MWFVDQPEYREELMRLLAFLLRYGPKSVVELENHTVNYNLELADAIGEIMKDEKASWARSLATGEG